PEQYRTFGAEMPGAGSAEPNRNTTMMQAVKTSFLRRSGVLKAWANLITVATAPLMPQSRRPFRPPGFCQPTPRRTQPGPAEWGLGAPTPVYRGRGATQPGQLDPGAQLISVRSRFSFSNTGASEKVNRSSWVSAVSENSVQAGTAMMSPRSSGCPESFRRTEPDPSKTCQTEDAEVRDRRVAAPAASRWNSVRMVVSASPPVAGLVYRTAAWPGSSTPGRPSASSSSWAASAASVYAQR